jgi:hypothetical protein
LHTSVISTIECIQRHPVAALPALYLSTHNVAQGPQIRGQHGRVVESNPRPLSR